MNDSSELQAIDPSPRPRRRIWLRALASLIVLLVGAGVAVWWRPAIVLDVVRFVRGDDTDPAARREVREKIELQEKLKARQTAGGRPSERDAEYRQRALGAWTQSRSDAERELILSADGTGLQIIRPKGFLATSYLGELVELDVVWKIENGRAIFDSVAGRPADMAQRVNDLFGTHRDRRIVEITDERILLFDEQDNEPSEWKRKVSPPPAESPD